MDLFHFTMQQLAPYPALLSEGGIPPIRTYLLNWLRRHQPLAEPRILCDNTDLSHDLNLKSGDWARLVMDLEDFYGIPILQEVVSFLHTVRDLEAYLQYQLSKFAA
ncbi:acyl carrier protein [Hymenobacter terrenus]|uniref:acyl carrier protein n=1 Tax=Hymenobacter terrenus TaxID=1629124 RepID=UPI000619397B|nr:acyl carrier protein [Hymenobacter terrenus]